ncbi:hypothetical protein [Clostridium sp.]|jgi:hypothetical protein|uniref:hypothetical protein n=1 Tax=Clostridium sp. TaxID=1506 RepID=UPI0029020A5F|nr:hypothetical protein [Clostridium sp.]MDU2155279.1 hypothetical protein [Clostridium sp.]
MDSIWIKIYLGTIVISIVCHILLGVMIKQHFRKIRLEDELKVFQERFKKEEGIWKRWSKYIIFFIPILNVLIVIIEWIHKNDSIYKIRKQVSG